MRLRWSLWHHQAARFPDFHSNEAVDTNNMQETFSRFIAGLQTSRDIDSLRAVLVDAGRDLGLTALAYVGFDEPGRSEPLYISNYPDRWTDRYIGRQYSRIDPVIERAGQDFMPFYWTCPDDIGSVPRAQQQLFEEAREHDIACGFTVPIHDSAGRTASFNVAAATTPSDFQAIVEANRPILHLMGIYFHAHAKEKSSPANDARRVKLSPREIDCLDWSAKGKSHADIAIILGLARRTVKFHIENAMRKFGVTTTRQAIVRATMLGFIAPP